MKKQIPALLATFLIIGFLVFAMGITGVSALMNKSGTSNSNSLALASSNSNQSQVDQLEARITEFQQREQQYQQLLSNDQTQIQQASQEVQQIQQLLFALQQHGLIQIKNDGTILITGQSNN